ncbi:MAG: hypothetical protein ABIJ95_09770 [Pseudomonadota bacterium]
MQELDDAELKKEIDEIMARVDRVCGSIRELSGDREEAAEKKAEQ